MTQTVREIQYLKAGVLTFAAPNTAMIFGCVGQNHIELKGMTSHGHGGLGLWLMGSVTEKVLRKAGCATLAVRPVQPLGNGTRDHD